MNQQQKALRKQQKEQFEYQTVQVKKVAQQFLQAYYGALMQNRATLISFYTENSTMSYGGQIYKGLEEIGDKIESFGFQSINYQIDDLDVQIGPIEGSFLVFAIGSLVMDGTDQFKFSQIFNILSNGSGGFYVHNDIFRTVL